VRLPRLDDAIEASHQALKAIIRGDVEPFMALYSDADDITIGNPFGPFATGRDATRAAGIRAASNYTDGEIVAFDRIATHTTDTLACVVEVERFSVRLAKEAELASVALRVTSLYRRETHGWRLVHRHADAITSVRPAQSVASPERGRLG
jgi:ketosteroid isomerase-like protein